MLKRNVLTMLLLALLTAALAACAADNGSDGESDEPSSAEQLGGLGQIRLPLTTSTATHTYQLNGTIELYKAGAFQQSVSISGTQASVTLANLTPGNYDVFLSGPTLLKDGASTTFTMVSANPHPVTVTANQTTVDNWAFSVAGDPVALGSLQFTVSVTEVPPS